MLAISTAVSQKELSQGCVSIATAMVTEEKGREQETDFLSTFRPWRLPRVTPHPRPERQPASSTKMTLEWWCWATCMKTLEGSGFPCLFSHFRKPTIKRITSGGDCFITESQDLDTQLPPMLKIVGRREMRKGWGRKGGGVVLDDLEVWFNCLLGLIPPWVRNNHFGHVSMAVVA